MLVCGNASGFIIARVPRALTFYSSPPHHNQPPLTHSTTNCDSMISFAHCISIYLSLRHSPARTYFVFLLLLLLATQSTIWFRLWSRVNYLFKWLWMFILWNNLYYMWWIRMLFNSIGYISLIIKRIYSRIRIHF